QSPLTPAPQSFPYTTLCRSRLVGNVLQLDPGHLLEQLARGMLGAAAARGTEAQFARVGPSVGYQLFHRVKRDARVHREDVGHVRHLRDRFEIALDVVSELRIQGRIEVERPRGG